MEILDICHHVYLAARAQNISVISQESRVYDSFAMIALLEVGVSETEKDLVYLNRKSPQNELSLRQYDYLHFLS